MTEEAARLIAYRLKWQMADVRALLAELEAEGVFVTYQPTTGELCTSCTVHLANESGFCPICEANELAIEAAEEMDAERHRLQHMKTKLENVMKTQRKRMRKRFLANPRDKENRMRWQIAQELLDQIEEQQRSLVAEDCDEDEWEEEGATLRTTARGR